MRPSPSYFTQQLSDLIPVPTILDGDISCVLCSSPASSPRAGPRDRRSVQTILDDPTIVAIFDAANTYDVETGQLALQKSRSQAVRNLAQQLINDHKAVRQQGRDLAKKLSVTPTPPKQFDLADAHLKAMKDLEGTSGADFDKAYVAHEVAFHQAVLDAVQSTLLPAITNAELKAFVEKVGPAFAGHLHAAKQLQTQLTS